MPGPPPKPQALRRRRNRVSSAAMLPAHGPSTPAPALPERACSCLEEERQACSLCEGTGLLIWHPLVLSWWRDVWASPMAHEYVEADKHGLFILANLHEDYWRTGEREIAAEIRLQEQRFGLSPIDRRRLQWQVAATEERLRKGIGAPRAAAQQPPRGKDPRKVLSMVKRS
jgi:hypothetical protein